MTREFVMTSFSMKRILSDKTIRNQKLLRKHL